MNHTSMNKLKIGLVQMSCTVDKADNLSKAIEGIRDAHQKGAQIVCLQELFTSLYFCDEENYDHFSLAEAIPGPSTDILSVLAKELGVVIIASLFEKGLKVSITTLQLFSMPMVLILENTGRCISLMIPITMRNFISPLVILAIKFSKQSLQL